MKTKLQGIAEKAKDQPKHRFRDLSGWLDKDNLRDMFHKLRKKAAPGVDRVDHKTYATNLESNLENLITQLKQGSYRANLVRRTHIPKGKDGKRPLGIPTLEDKLLQKGVATILEAIFEQDFLRYSYGYRPERDAHKAIKDLKLDLQYGSFGWVVEADIKGFFNNIEHGWMERMLEQRINDKRFLRLIKKWLKAGILEEDGQIVNPATGTPQGGIVSPILANVYLHYTLDLWFEKIVKPRCRGYAKLVRYCDDFVCAFQYKSDAESFYRELANRLKKFNLEVAEEKTRIVRFSRHDVENNCMFEFLGFEFRWKKDREGKPRVYCETSKAKLQKSLSNLRQWVKSNVNKNVSKFMSEIVLKMRGYLCYYGIRGNSRRLAIFWREAMYTISKWLNRRSQRRSYTWQAFRDLLKTYKFPVCRVVEIPSARDFKFTCC